MINRRVATVLLMIAVLVAGFSIYSYHESITRTIPEGTAGTSGRVKSVPLGDGTIQTEFVNVSAWLVLTKTQNNLVTTGYLVTVNGTPVAGAEVYISCQTGFLSCGSGVAVTSANGGFVSNIPVQAACGEEVQVQIGYQGSSVYAPYGQNYVAQSPCLTPG